MTVNAKIEKTSPRRNFVLFRYTLINIKRKKTSKAVSFNRKGIPDIPIIK